MQINQQLLELSDIVQNMDNLFKFNDELASLILDNKKILDKKNKLGDKIFPVTNENISIVNILKFIKKVEELKNSYKEIKEGNINDVVVKKFKNLNNIFKKLISDYALLLQHFRISLGSTKEFTKEEKLKIDKNFGEYLYDILEAETNIIDSCITFLENNVKESKTSSYKEEIEPKHIVEIKTDGQIFINGIFSEIELTSKLSTLLKKLIKLDKNGNFPLVKTEDLADGWKKNNDAFRTKLSRLRKETKKLFEIKNVDNKYNESCYTVIFKD